MTYFHQITKIKKIMFEKIDTQSALWTPGFHICGPSKPQIKNTYEKLHCFLSNGVQQWLCSIHIVWDILNCLDMIQSM